MNYLFTSILVLILFPFVIRLVTVIICKMQDSKRINYEIKKNKLAEVQYTPNIQTAANTTSVYRPAGRTLVDPEKRQGIIIDQEKYKKAIEVVANVGVSVEEAANAFRKFGKLLSEREEEIQDKLDDSLENLLKEKTRAIDL